MSLFSGYTRKQDLRQSPLFRKYGAKGVKQFCVIWGAVTYSFLFGFSGMGLFWLSQIDDMARSRFIATATVSLTEGPLCYWEG